MLVYSYVERNKYIQSAIKNCELNATLEQFTSLVIRPGSPSSGPDSTPMVSLKVPGLGREHSRGSNAGTPVRQELSITVDEPLSPNNPRSAGLTSVPSEEVDGGTLLLCLSCWCHSMSRSCAALRCSVY